MAGHGAPPEWYVIDAAARAWGVAPWEVEAGPALWIVRFAAVENARAQASEPKKLPIGGSGQTRRVL